MLEVPYAESGEREGCMVPGDTLMAEHRESRKTRGRSQLKYLKHRPAFRGLLEDWVLRKRVYDK